MERNIEASIFEWCDRLRHHGLLTEQSEQVNIVDILVDLAKYEKQSFLGKSRLRFNLERHRGIELSGCVCLPSEKALIASSHGILVR
jgi:hypothetical protein